MKQKKIKVERIKYEKTEKESNDKILSERRTRKKSGRGTINNL